MPINVKDAAGTATQYFIFRTQGNKSSYISSGHNDLNQDMLVITPSDPKQTSATYGTRRTSIKFLRDVDVATPGGTTERKTLKVELSVSVPIGATTADLNEARARMK